MKTKTFVIAGMVAAAISPAMAKLNSHLDKNTGNIIYEDEDSLQRAEEYKQWLAQQKESEEIKDNIAKCQSADGNWFNGKCVSANPCTSGKKSDEKHCVKYFEKVQVASPQRGVNIVDAYVKNILKWKGCAGGFEVPKSNAMGDDYIKCVNPANGDVRMFVFDDLSESNNVLADNNYYYSMCLALKGKTVFPKKDATSVDCAGISKKTCENKLNGAFKDNKCTIKF